jgi:hypothetical protein
MWPLALVLAVAAYGCYLLGRVVGWCDDEEE